MKTNVGQGLKMCMGMQTLLPFVPVLLAHFTHVKPHQSLKSGKHVRCVFTINQIHPQIDKLLRATVKSTQN